MPTRFTTTPPTVAPEPVRLDASGQPTVLHLEGVVGVAQAKRLHALALEIAPAGRRVAVRCEHLQHLDASAVQVLLALAGALKANGAELALQGLPDPVQQTLRIAGLDAAF